MFSIFLLFIYSQKKMTMQMSSAVPRQRDVATTIESIEQQNGMGIVLWSYGRSGTTFFATTLHKVLGTEWCNGCKESFRPSSKHVIHPLDLKTLQVCQDQNQDFLHVKPEHLARGEEVSAAVASSLLSSKLQWFFGMCQQTGFKVLVANIRANALARDVSSQSLRCRGEEECMHETARNEFCAHPDLTSLGFRDPIEAWEARLQVWLRGIEIAQQMGFVVIRTTFTEVTQNTKSVCSLITRVLLASGSGKRESAFNCSSAESKRSNKYSKDELTLHQRVGKKANRCIIGAIQRAEDPAMYAWMLDLNQQEPPAKYRSQFGYLD